VWSRTLGKALSVDFGVALAPREPCVSVVCGNVCDFSCGGVGSKPLALGISLDVRGVLDDRLCFLSGIDSSAIVCSVSRLCAARIGLSDNVL
jgi:hypothetical protein